MDNPLPHSHSPSADHWRCSLTALPDRAQLERAWRSLEAEANAPFFLSWDWIGCWLDSVPPEQHPSLFRIEHAGRVVGMALLAAAGRRWLGLVPRRALYLHETGTALDSLTIEYNGILAVSALREEIMRRAIAWLVESRLCDELHLSGVPAAALRGLSQQRIAIRLRDDKPVYAIDLARVAAEGGDFLATLSANTRTQMRRALRQYESVGPLRMVEAATAEQASMMLSEMIPLHQTYWRRRGRDGAFANPDFVAFHHRLIATSFAAGRIQYLRCDAGTSVVGYLYNFRNDRHVYSYQSGFNYDLLPRSKPGWVCHYLAIMDSLRRGDSIYDLLAGHSQFKSSFAEVHEELVWAIAERRGLLTVIDRSLRACKHAMTRAR